jgi:hypothetical protein
VTLEEALTAGPAQVARTRVLFDGSKRYRIEQTEQVGTVWETTSVTLIGAAYRYTSELQIDGTTIWRATSRGVPGAYPLAIPATCHGGWENRGVDLIAGRVADRVGCAGETAGDFWIDRASRLVVRTQTSDDPSIGTTVREVVDLQIGPLTGVEWSLPEGATLE